MLKTTNLIGNPTTGAKYFKLNYQLVEKYLLEVKRFICNTRSGEKTYFGIIDDRVSI